MSGPYRLAAPPPRCRHSWRLAITHYAFEGHYRVVCQDCCEYASGGLEFWILLARYLHLRKLPLYEHPDRAAAEA